MKNMLTNTDPEKKDAQLYKMTAKNLRATEAELGRQLEIESTKAKIEAALEDVRLGVMEGPAGKQIPLNIPAFKGFFSDHIDILLNDVLLTTPWSKEATGIDDNRPSNADLLGAFSSLTVLRRMAAHPDITQKDVKDMENALSPNRHGKKSHIDAGFTPGEHTAIKDAIPGFSSMDTQAKLRAMATLVQKRFCELGSTITDIGGTTKGIANHFVNTTLHEEKKCKDIIGRAGATATEMIDAIDDLITGACAGGKGGQGQGGTARFVQPMLRNVLDALQVEQDAALGNELTRPRAAGQA
jgi:hypothetical protein